MQRHAYSPRKQGEVISQALRFYAIEGARAWDVNARAVMAAQFDAAMVRTYGRMAAATANEFAQYIEYVVARLQGKDVIRPFKIQGPGILIGPMDPDELGQKGDEES